MALVNIIAQQSLNELRRYSVSLYARTYSQKTADMDIPKYAILVMTPTTELGRCTRMKSKALRSA